MTEQANYYSKRNQLEELFLECVEQVRRDIHRRKATSIGLHGNINGTLKKKKLGEKDFMDKFKLGKHKVESISENVGHNLFMLSYRREYIRSGIVKMLN